MTTDTSTISQLPLGRSVRSNINLTLGLIQVPVSIHTAVAEEEDSALNNLCNNEHAPMQVRQNLACPGCGNNGHVAPLVKGQKVGAGYVVVPPEVIAQTVESADAFKDEIALTVHRSSEVAATMPTGKVYYLNVKAGGKQGNTYQTLVSLLVKRPDLAFVGQFAIKGAPMLYQVVATDGVLMLRQLARPELVKAAPQVDGVVEEATLGFAEQYAEQILATFKPEEYRSAKATIISDYVSKQTPAGSSAKPAAAAAEAGADVDLADQLQAALAAAAGPKRRRATKKSTASLKAVS